MDHPLQAPDALVRPWRTAAYIAVAIAAVELLLLLVIGGGKLAGWATHRMASPERESSVKQMIGRIVETIGGWGRNGGYFATDDEADTFEAELKAILVNQHASFNSPVWFNVGFEKEPQCSACFILSIDDSMESILDWIRREGIIFRGGSGSGLNLSRLRSSKEQLSKGGYASGPVSFMSTPPPSAIST